MEGGTGGTPRQAEAKRFGETPLGLAVGVIIMLALLAGAILLAKSLFEGPRINPGPHPSWLSTVFRSRGVVGAVRIAIIFAAGYVVISICALIGGRQWLSRVGPLEVSRSGAVLDAMREKQAGDLAETRDEMDRLRIRLSQSTGTQEKASETAIQALEYTARMADEEEKD